MSKSKTSSDMDGSSITVLSLELELEFLADVVLQYCVVESISAVPS